MKKNARSGFSLVEVMITIGLVFIGLAAVFSLVESSTKQRSIANSMFGIEQIRRNLSTMLGNSSVWAATVANNSTLGCLKAPPIGSCTHGAAINFAIFSAGSAAYYDPATQGFKFNGTICTIGSADCALSLSFVAQIECPGATATCVAPSSIVTEGKFTNVVFPPGNSVAFNPMNYLITVREDAAAATGGGAVFQLKCVFDIGSGTPCTPLVCPGGFSDAGTFDEWTFLRDAGSYGGVTDFSRGYHVRTCYK